MITTNVLIVLSATLATLITRFSPLWIPKKIQSKNTFRYLSQVLPLASFGLLVIYSLKDTNITNFFEVVIKVISITTIIIVQYKRNNVLLSIFFGTSIYMILQYVLIYFSSH